MQETTFVIIKPNAIKKNKIGAILSRFEKEGLKVVGAKFLKMSQELCETFYEEHKARPFFLELTSFMTSFPVLVLALRGEGACARVREILGNTDPAKASPESLRFQYGDSVGENALHGSDSLKSAERELKLFFKNSELYEEER